MTWIAIAFGGALGSLARHAITLLVPSQRFPWATVIVNISGCFVIGFLYGLTTSRRLALPALGREFVFVGVLGGFTTFSTFGLDTLTLAQSQSSYAVMNVAAQVLGGLIAVWLGYRIGVL